MAGILRYAFSSSRIRGCTPHQRSNPWAAVDISAADLINAALTVFFDTPNTRAIALIGNPSARYSRRISAQSSTDKIPLVLLARVRPTTGPGIKIRMPRLGQLSRAADGGFG